MELNDMARSNDKEIIVAGEKVTVSSSDDVKIRLTQILKDKGIDSFTIIVDGDEITSTDDLPEKFDGHDIEVQRYVKPGC